MGKFRVGHQGNRNVNFRANTRGNHDKFKLGLLKGHREKTGQYVHGEQKKSIHVSTIDPSTAAHESSSILTKVTAIFLIYLSIYGEYYTYAKKKNPHFQDYRDQMGKVRDYRKAYRKLKVSVGADEHTVRKAYLKLCLQKHPDNSKGAEEFLEIREAYNLLKNIPSSEKHTSRISGGGLILNEKTDRDGEDRFSIVSTGQDKEKYQVNLLGDVHDLSTSKELVQTPQEGYSHERGMDEENSLVSIQQDSELKLLQANQLTRVLEKVSACIFASIFSPLSVIMFSKPAMAHENENYLFRNSAEQIQNLNKLLRFASENPPQFGPRFSEAEVSSIIDGFSSIKDFSFEGPLKVLGMFVHENLEKYQEFSEEYPTLSRLAEISTMIGAKAGIGFSLGGPHGAAAGAVEEILEQIGSYAINYVAGEYLHEGVGWVINQSGEGLMKLDSTLSKAEANALAGSFMSVVLVSGNLRATRSSMLHHGVPKSLKEVLLHAADPYMLKTNNIFPVIADLSTKIADAVPVLETVPLGDVHVNSDPLGAFKNQYEKVFGNPFKSSSGSFFGHPQFSSSTFSFSHNYPKTEFKPMSYSDQALRNIQHQSYLRWRAESEIPAGLNIPKPQPFEALQYSRRDPFDNYVGAAGREWVRQQKQVQAMYEGMRPSGAANAIAHDFAVIEYNSKIDARNEEKEKFNKEAMRINKQMAEFVSHKTSFISPQFKVRNGGHMMYKMVSEFQELIDEKNKKNDAYNKRVEEEFNNCINGYNAKVKEKNTKRIISEFHRDALAAMRKIDEAVGGRYIEMNNKFLRAVRIVGRSPEKFHALSPEKKERGYLLLFDVEVEMPYDSEEKDSPSNYPLQRVLPFDIFSKAVLNYGWLSEEALLKNFQTLFDEDVRNIDIARSVLSALYREEIFNSRYLARRTIIKLNKGKIDNQQLAVDLSKLVHKVINYRGPNYAQEIYDSLMDFFRTNADNLEIAKFILKVINDKAFGAVLKRKAKMTLEEFERGTYGVEEFASSISGIIMNLRTRQQYFTLTARLDPVSNEFLAALSPYILDNVLNFNNQLLCSEKECGVINPAAAIVDDGKRRLVSGRRESYSVHNAQDLMRIVKDSKGNYIGEAFVGRGETKGNVRWIEAGEKVALDLFNHIVGDRPIQSRYDKQLKTKVKRVLLPDETIAEYDPKSMTIFVKNIPHWISRENVTFKFIQNESKIDLEEFREGIAKDIYSLQKEFYSIYENLTEEERQLFHRRMN